ncbi:hypothetical protein AGMMS49941_03380 [Deferribacterales bacterium]|nr:hypothetical protein AGMMS49941_03380 [Deferribacterales bacterium]
MYNAGRYIAQCLESIIYQTHEDIEIIVVNDGSADNSAEIVEQYIARDSRIRLINQSNSGVATARNNGLNSVNLTGGYIHFRDADDYLYDLDYYEKMLSTAIATDADITRSGLYDESAGYSWLKYDHSYIAKTLDDKIKMYLMPVWTSLFKLSFLKDNNLHFDTALSQSDDMVLNWEATVLANKIAVCPHVLYYYRKTEGSLVNANNEQAQIRRTRERALRFEKLVALQKKYNFVIPTPAKPVPLITKYKLFSVLTLLTKKAFPSKLKYYLFGVLPVLTVKGR